MAPDGRGRPRVYVAGPITAGDRYTNIHNAIRVGQMMVRDGLAPFVPHLDHYMFPHPDDLTWEVALDWDLAWVRASEVVYRMPGESKGADLECSMARQLGIPVFEDYLDLLKWADLRKRERVSA